MSDYVFDRSYYMQWYGRAAASTQRHRALVTARYVHSCLDFLCIPIRNMLDVGCGLGHWKKYITSLTDPPAYAGLEVSSFLCSRYGWEHGSIADISPSSDYDLVVCRNVLQYLGDHNCQRALHNLSQLATRALYIEVLTADDYPDRVSADHTDVNVYKRPASWYSQRLPDYFIKYSPGMYIERSCTGHFLSVW